MKRSVLFTLVAVIGLFILVGCGKKDMSSYAGTYTLDYSKYVGDPDDAKNKENWTIELNADGTGKSNRDGLNINVEWSIDGEIVKLTEKFGAIIEYSGTLKDGKLDIYNGEKTDALTLEAIFIKE